MSQQARDHASATSSRPTRRSKPPQPAKRPTTLGELEVGRVALIRVQVTGNISGDKFCRAIADDGTSSEPRTLPAEWPLVQERE